MAAERMGERGEEESRDLDPRGCGVELLFYHESSDSSPNGTSQEYYSSVLLLLLQGKAGPAALKDAGCTYTFCHPSCRKPHTL
jgi:hypothetical protein